MLDEQHSEIVEHRPFDKGGQAAIALVRKTLIQRSE